MADVKSKSYVNEKKKGKDAVFLWAVGICVAVCLLVLGVFLLADPVAGHRERKSALAVFSADELRMVVQDPTVTHTQVVEGQVVTVGGEVLLSAEQVDAIDDELAWALRESRFGERESTLTGLWLPSVTVSSREARTKIYLGENALYLEKDGKSTSFEVKEENMGRYQALRESVLSYLP